MPVRRSDLSNTSFRPCLGDEPATFICNSVYTVDGLRYGVIDCTIRTAKYTTAPTSLSTDKTYTITYTGDGANPGVTVTEATTGKLFRIIDSDSAAKTVTYIDA